jgi:phage recombination protein Bet
MSKHANKTAPGQKFQGGNVSMSGRSPTEGRGNAPLRDAPAHVRASELSVFKRSVARSGMGEDSFVQALTQTALSSLITWDQVDLETLLLAAERLGLDPLGREIFLVRDEAEIVSPPVVVVGVDGWSRVINSHKEFAGLRFKESDSLIDGVPEWIECSMYRWDRKVATTVREYLVEVRGDAGAWLTHPRRMLRHKAMVQCARLAFGFVGVYDQDEAARVLESRRSQKRPMKDTQGQGQPNRSGNVSTKSLGVSALRQRLGV